MLKLSQIMYTPTMKEIIRFWIRPMLLLGYSTITIVQNDQFFLAQTIISNFDLGQCGST